MNLTAGADMLNQLDETPRKGADSALPKGGSKDHRSRRLHTLIREDIIEGRLAPGTRLKVGELAAYYGTSTNPVREALNRLEGEGIVIITQNQGARVRAIDEDFIRNIYEIRILIEPYLVRWFVDYATDEDIRKLRAIQKEIDKVIETDLERFNELNEAFHNIIYANHYNSEARQIIKRQEAMLHILSRRFGLSRSRKKAICQEHHRLIEAIERGETQLAVETEECHVRGSVELLLEQMRIHRNSN